MADLSQSSVKSYFETEVQRGRRLLPDPGKLRDFGSYLKYSEATALMADPAVGRVLDVGCNHGSLEAMFHHQYPELAATTSIDGIDIAGTAVEQAQQLGLENCCFRCYDGDSIPFDDHSFDLVVLIEVIEHVIDKDALFQEISRVLKPLGRLFVTTPNPQCWPLRLESRMYRAACWAAGKQVHEKDEFVTHDQLLAALQRAGFVAARQDSIFSHPRLYLQLFGWCLLPPLPSRLQFRWHKYSLTKINPRKLPRWFQQRFCWSLIGEMHKTGGRS
jgi:SAM-dependent methyltransferase